MKAKDLIQKLQLQPHPEGGYYKETYRSSDTITVNNNTRNVSTAIYYLLEDSYRSAFHRIKSDELWFFHQGQPVEVVFIKDGKLITILLGDNFEKGEVFQAVIPANTWFAAKIKDQRGHSLVSCTVAPGFDFADFELAKKEELIAQYPHLTEVIEEWM